jgi:mannose-1-phosphate guanylyltransferase
VENGIGTAFVLGAGLGTRLRPLTDDRPKPLVPIFHKPLITFAFDHLRAFGVKHFVVNTHHRPEAYERLLGARKGLAEYVGCSVRLRHEPILLDTAGGIGNVRDWLGDAPFLVHNGDVVADLPLDRLMAEHAEQANAATLVLRRSGGPLQVQFDEDRRALTDIRGMIGGRSEPAFLFSGVYALSPAVFRYIPKEGPLSIVPVFLKMLQAGERVGGIILDEGIWFDLGTRESYLQAHRFFSPASTHPIQLSYELDRPWPVAVHPEAEIGEEVVLEGATALGARATVGHGAHLTDSVVWEDAKIASRSRLEACIVRDGRSAAGEWSAADL